MPAAWAFLDSLVITYLVNPTDRREAMAVRG
jgi:hypothetical protein